ncbi:hypothetical protein QBC47DRAFT_403475 [Echria macrotheca]|uniref:Zn(2)-C6 fungal-type domain-containing protein n=1 Tax=Echria macrotheca TaxID=438768 RepID=A0AAJ0F867_9PEZI|nr:hypothetical protein QBC47DRAFT_403475 [Echria macrotheca]
MSLSIEADCSSSSSLSSSSSSLLSPSDSSGSPKFPSNPRRIRPTLPANPSVRNPKRDIITTSSRHLFIPPKNVHVKAACDACRRRKVKCSGGRPRCIACDRADSECKYISAPAETHLQALKRKYGELQER